MNDRIQRMIEAGYSAPAIAMIEGFSVGSPGYYDFIKELGFPVNWNLS